MIFTFQLQNKILLNHYYKCAICFTFNLYPLPTLWVVVLEQLKAALYTNNLYF